MLSILPLESRQCPPQFSRRGPSSLLLCGVVATLFASALAFGQARSATPPELEPFPRGSYQPERYADSRSLDEAIGKPEWGWELWWAEDSVPREMEGYEVVRKRDDSIIKQMPQPLLLRHAPSLTDVAIRRWGAGRPPRGGLGTPAPPPEPQPELLYRPATFHGLRAGSATFRRVGSDGFENCFQFIFRDGDEYFEIRSFGKRAEATAMEVSQAIHKLRRNPDSAKPISAPDFPKPPARFERLPSPFDEFP